MDIDININAIQAKWEEVQEALKESNQSTYMLLKNAQLVGLENGKVVIAFKFAFHKEKMATSSNLDLMVEIFQKVYGVKLALEPVVNENLEFQTTPSSNGQQSSNGEGKIALDGLLDSFGGRVVE